MIQISPLAMVRGVLLFSSSPVCSFSSHHVPLSLHHGLSVAPRQIMPEFQNGFISIHIRNLCNYSSLPLPATAVNMTAVDSCIPSSRLLDYYAYGQPQTVRKLSFGEHDEVGLVCPLCGVCKQHEGLTQSRMKRYAQSVFLVYMFLLVVPFLRRSESTRRGMGKRRYSSDNQQLRRILTPSWVPSISWISVVARI